MVQMYTAKISCTCTTGDINEKIHSNMVHNGRKWRQSLKVTNLHFFHEENYRAIICYTIDELRTYINGKE